MTKNKLKNLITLSLIVTFVFSALPIVAVQKIPQIPEDIKKQVPEKDWIELYCFEAKSRGGEAVAKTEALAELLPPLLSQVGEFGVNITVPDYVEITKNLELKLEAICQQSTIEGAQVKVQEFISTAEGLRGTLGSNLRSQIEPSLKARGEKLKARLEKELRAEGKSLGEEIETKLRAEAEQEAQKIEARLRIDITADIIAVHQELYNQKVAGGATDGELQAYAAELMRLGEQQGNERGRREGEKFEAELKAKYERLAEKERERITEIMEKKADEIGGEEKRKLEAIRDGFENLTEKIEGVSETKMSRWLVFRDKAIQKKKEILIATMGSQIDQGKELIMTYKSELDEARAEGADVPSAEELVAKLEADKQVLINRLANSELNEVDIRTAGKELKIKWNKVRFDMEKMREQKGQEIYRIMSQRLEEKGFTRKRITSLEPENSAFIVLKEFLNYNENSDVNSLLKYKEKLIVTLAEYSTLIK